MRPRVRFPGHVVASGRLVRRSLRSMAAIIEVSIYRGSKVDMAASVDINSVAGCASCSTLLSSYRSWNRRGRKRKCVQCVISVFRVLSGGDEARYLVTRLFPRNITPPVIPVSLTS